MSAAASDWRMSAACRDFDPDLFFPVATGGSAVTQVAEAKQVCAGCPVRVPCLDWALRHSQDVGVWGGLTGEERNAFLSLTRGAA